MDEKIAAKFTAVALHIAKSEALARCTPISIVSAMLEVAAIGLDPDPSAGHVYFVPYGEGYGDNRIYNVELQIGYKGYIWLAFAAGWDIRVDPVYSCDTFTRDASDPFNPRTIFIESIDRQQGDPQWVYENLKGVRVIAKYIPTGDIRDSFVSKSIIEKRRLMSPNQKMPTTDKSIKALKPAEKKKIEDGLPIKIWEEHYEAMAISKAIRHFTALLPRNGMISRNMQRIDAIDGTVVKGSSLPVNEPSPSALTAPTPVAQLEQLDSETVSPIFTEHEAVYSGRGPTDDDDNLIVDRETGEIEQPIHATEKASKHVDLAEKIRGAKNPAELDDIVNSLSDFVRDEYQDIIDEARDLFR